MVPLAWAQPALDDLREIFEFIARDSPRYAQLTVERITSAAGQLVDFPHLGPVLPEFPGLTYRHVIVGAYRVICREDITSERMLVMGVIHASRDLPPIMKHRRSGTGDEG